jgi:hypothetical protein
VSILIGLDGWVRGVEPRSKVSMMIHAAHRIQLQP